MQRLRISNEKVQYLNRKNDAAFFAELSINIIGIE